MTEARNLTRKLLGEHLSAGELVPGEEIDLSVDQRDLAKKCRFCRVPGE